MTSDYILSVNQTTTEPNPQSTLLIRVQSHNHRTQISSKVINVEVRLPPSHVTIHLEPDQSHSALRGVMATEGTLGLCLINVDGPERGSRIDHSGRD